MATYTLRLSFSANGGSGAPSVVIQNVSSTAAHVTVTATIPATRPTRSAYNFTGWSGNGGKYQPSASVSRVFTRQIDDTGNLIDQTETIPFTATWEHNSAYVNFNANGGSGAPNRVSHWEGYSVKLPDETPTRYGYNFLGWSKDSSATTATYLPGGTYALYTTVTLYAVWQIAASEATVENGTLGSVLPISIMRNNSAYKHKLEYKYGNATGTIAENVDTSCSWTPPLSLAAQFPNSVSGTCTITCKTYDGSNLIGTKTTTITLTIPDAVRCSIESVLLTETVEGIETQFGGFVQGHSKIRVTVTEDTSAAQGASVSSITVRINGQTLSGNNKITDIITNFGTLSFSVSITDSRGRIAEYNGTFNVYAYATPTIIHTVKRAEATPSSIEVEYTYGISPCGDHNDKKIEIHYKKTTDAYYTEEPVIIPIAYSATGTYTITGTDPNTTYLVKTIVSDAFNEIAVEGKVAAKGNRIIHISKRKKTISLHQTNPDDGLDHEYETMEFHKGIKQGNIVISAEEFVAIYNLLSNVFISGLGTDRARFGGVPVKPGLQIDWDVDMLGAVLLNGREIMKSLWTGLWSSGSITVNGISQYKLFIVRMDGQGTQMLVGLNGVYWRGEGGYVSSSTNEVRYYINATLSGDKLTMVDCHSIQASGTRIAHTVTEIIGVI